MSDHMKEAERLLEQYDDACLGIIDMSEEQARAALLAHIQRGAVPEGYDIAPTFRGYAKLGAGHYVLHNCPRTDEDHPSLVIAIATEEEKAGRQVGELRQSQPGLIIQPERIAVRIDFKSVAALDALEQQLRFLREDSFPDSLATPAPDHFRDAAEMVVAVQPSCMTCTAPTPAEAPDKWEYYYRDNDCPAADSGDPNCICWHDEGRGPYNNARHDDEDTFLEWRRVKVPTPAEVPMPEPVAYGVGNTAITGHTNRLMMVRLAVPLYDQYAGAHWHPLVLADEARTYGDAREAAGYARGLAEAGRDAERYRYVKNNPAIMYERWEAIPLSPEEIDAAIDAALRGEVK